ncbi:SPOSA6832_04561 [Sporobolomyces salmonicolor]|uniref:SPOSA6832_04561-mRNA-1:cds n=1 Tax=Sporidiobolus salmonicolor TaxID=5005 RepID=A0A0D6ESB2_SPOSA|nr:SPOSA6832_04561 [Sporobolomyces salmonicolor]
MTDSAPPPARATPAQIARLGSFSTCEISDALIKLGHPTGGFVPDLEKFSGEEGARVVGEAFTVEVCQLLLWRDNVTVAHSLGEQMVDTRTKEAPKLEEHFIDLVAPDSIVFISTPHPSLGGLLATSLHYKGVKGVMISGRCRDLAELRALGLPVFARGHSTLGQSPFTRPSRVQIPLSISPAPSPSSSSSSPELDFPPTTIQPFDLIIADLDGVVVVRPGEVESVCDLAQRGREVDERCRGDLEQGKGVKETFKKHRGK